MDLLELVVWVFFAIAVVVFNLVQKVKRKTQERQQGMEQTGTAAQAPDTPQARQAERAAERAADRQAERQADLHAARQRPGPAAPPVVVLPPMGQEHWGREAPLGQEQGRREPHPVEAVSLEIIPKQPQPGTAYAPIVAVRRAAPPPARARRPSFRTPREVRQGIIAMTVLGPCRAIEPYEQPEFAPPPVAAKPVRKP